MHPAKEGFSALPFFDEFDLSTVDILLISQYVDPSSPLTLHTPPGSAVISLFEWVCWGLRRQDQHRILLFGYFQGLGPGYVYENRNTIYTSFILHAPGYCILVLALLFLRPYSDDETHSPGLFDIQQWLTDQ